MLNGFSQRYLLKENSCSNWFDIPETKSVAFTVLPYVHGISKKIQRMLNELDIKVVLKPYRTIANCVPSPNNLVKEELSGRFIKFLMLIAISFILLKQNGV